jgi:hypothetical protein
MSTPSLAAMALSTSSLRFVRWRVSSATLSILVAMSSTSPWHGILRRSTSKAILPGQVRALTLGFSTAVPIFMFLQS